MKTGFLAGSINCYKILREPLGGWMISFLIGLPLTGVELKRMEVIIFLKVNKSLPLNHYTVSHLTAVIDHLKRNSKMPYNSE